MTAQPLKAPTPFDTLSYAKKLQTVGFTPEQAEIQEETLLSVVQEQLVDKRALKVFEHELKRDIKKLEHELKHDSKDIEAKTKTHIESLRNELKQDLKTLALCARESETKTC